MIELEVKALRAAAAEAAAVAGAANSVPILGNVLIDGSAAGVRFCATDLDMMIDRRVDVARAEALKTTVPARTLAAIAAKLPADAQATLRLGSSGLSPGALEILCGRSRFTLQTLPAEEFPLIDAGEWDAQFELAAFDLAKLIDSTGFAASTEETRYYLNGIFLHHVEADNSDPEAGPRPALLRDAATDGHRLARYQMELPDGAQTLPDVIVPRKAVGLIRKLCDAAGEGASVDIAVSRSKIRVEAGESTIVSKLIDGTFPDYSRVIPVGNANRMTVDREALKEAIERVTVIDSGKERHVKVELGAAVATLTARSVELGSGVEEVPVEAAEALTIGFNGKYLLDILGHLGGPTVEAELGDPSAPVLVRDPGSDRQLFVLMPMRV